MLYFLDVFYVCEECVGKWFLIILFLVVFFSVVDVGNGRVWFGVFFNYFNKIGKVIYICFVV